jgi:hypothetical protein
MPNGYIHRVISQFIGIALTQNIVLGVTERIVLHAAVFYHSRGHNREFVPLSHLDPSLTDYA